MAHEVTVDGRVVVVDHVTHRRIHTLADPAAAQAFASTIRAAAVNGASAVQAAYDAAEKAATPPRVPVLPVQVSTSWIDGTDRLTYTFTSTVQTIDLWVSTGGRRDLLRLGAGMSVTRSYTAAPGDAWEVRLYNAAGYIVASGVLL